MCETPGLTDLPAPRKPSVLRYGVVFLMLVVVWALVFELWIRPGFLGGRGHLGARAATLVVPPLVVALGAFLCRLRNAINAKQAAELQQAEREFEARLQREQKADQEAAILAGKRFSLEVLSMGVSIECYTQAEPWDEIQSQDHPDRIIPRERGIYPEGPDERERKARESQAAVLKRTLGWLTGEWAIPTFLAGPALQDQRMANLLESELREALDFAGLPNSALAVVEAKFGESPVSVIQDLFRFMEEHEDVPATCLIAEDSLSFREALVGVGASREFDSGPWMQCGLTSSIVAFVLARKERMASMQQLAQEESREPMSPYWDKVWSRQEKPAFTTSQWLPNVWSMELIERFSRLQVLGHLHRPQEISYQTEDGLLGPASQSTTFCEAWERLRESRSHGETLTHLFFDYGSVEHGRNFVPLARAFDEFEPDWDPFEHGINLNLHLGNTGSNSPYVSLALAVTAACREGGLSVCADLRSEEGACLLMVSEPPDWKDSEGGEDPLESGFAIVAV